ncbi:acyl-CoA desaturase [Folsomia candida]|uniref:acyl-CoA desaturase n=1 Tax=Folsomia candida TaxID=158441 RepID=UPI000B8F77B4|nr:acyl-CoA desaturase [Folsomia candida]
MALKTSTASKNHVFFKRAQLGPKENEEGVITKGDKTRQNFADENDNHVETLASSEVENHVESEEEEVPYRVEIAWRSTIILSVIHFMGIWGLINLLVGKIYLKSFAIQWVIGQMGALGTTGGAHRYWAHRSYRATRPLQIFLAFCQTISVQNSIYEWVRDHRVHHKFTETNADPHNAKRGFFFAHMGWLMVRKHPDVIRKGATVDMSDLENDPVVSFQRRHYLPLITIIAFILPTVIVAWSGETWLNSWLLTMFRYILALHLTWLVNSAAHLYGMRPYDKGISPRECWYVSMFALGEGWHNYHHVYPQDYRTSEFGIYHTNLTALFIDMCAYFGWVYGRKTVPKRIVEARVLRTGDGSEYRHH